MNDLDETDLADDELRDSRGRTREDYEADEADRLIKEMKIDGSYKRWRKSGLSYAEFQRREARGRSTSGRAAAAGARDGVRARRRKTRGSTWLEITQIEMADEDNGPDHLTLCLSDTEAIQLFEAVEPRSATTSRRCGRASAFRRGEEPGRGRPRPGLEPRGSALARATTTGWPGSGTTREASDRGAAALRGRRGLPARRRSGRVRLLRLAGRRRLARRRRVLSPSGLGRGQGDSGVQAGARRSARLEALREARTRQRATREVACG